MGSRPHIRLAPAWKLALDILYPASCGGCDTRGTLFCDECRRLVEPPTDETHNVRGAATLVCGGQFSGPLRTAIHRFKYESDCPLAVPLAGLVLEVLRQSEWWGGLQKSPPAIVPVPLHPRRQKARGYNQCKLLVQELSRLTGWTLADELRRKKETISQVGLDMAQRAENVRDAFVWSGGDAPKRVLLVDDVCTTGATLSECVAALKQAGSRRVYVATVARAANHEADGMHEGGRGSQRNAAR